jgi:putative oxidoreductase
MDGVIATWASTLVVVGRVLMGGLFVIGGVSHFGELAPLTEACRARGVPSPRLSLVLASLFQIVAGAMLIIGFLLPWAMLGLILFTLVASAVMMDFWNQAGERRTNSIHGWMSNIALIGGLLIAGTTA